MHDKQTQLKTLKDIDYNYGMIDGSNETNTGELRKEVIKWIKELSREELMSNEAYIANNESSDAYTTVKWIKHFFNIPEEELKNA